MAHARLWAPGREVPVALPLLGSGQFLDLHVSLCDVAQQPAGRQEGQGLWDRQPLTPVTTGGQPQGGAGVGGGGVT